jgi:alpha-glucosidase (family GH31 glycosyl hydrolase)
VYNNGTWPAAFVGAAYPHMLNRMVWEGMGAPGKQYVKDNVMLARSAWAGSQRYGSAVWSGDTSSNFANLNQQFRAGLNLVMSGIPYWTTDIGYVCIGGLVLVALVVHALVDSIRFDSIRFDSIRFEHSTA